MKNLHKNWRSHFPHLSLEEISWNELTFVQPFYSTTTFKNHHLELVARMLNLGFWTVNFPISVQVFRQSTSKEIPRSAFPEWSEHCAADCRIVECFANWSCAGDRTRYGRTDKVFHREKTEYKSDWDRSGFRRLSQEALSSTWYHRRRFSQTWSSHSLPWSLFNHW